MERRSAWKTSDQEPPSASIPCGTSRPRLKRRRRPGRPAPRAPSCAAGTRTIPAPSTSIFTAAEAGRTPPAREARASAIVEAAAERRPFRGARAEEARLARGHSHAVQAGLDPRDLAREHGIAHRERPLAQPIAVRLRLHDHHVGPGDGPRAHAVEDRTHRVRHGRAHGLVVEGHEPLEAAAGVVGLEELEGRGVLLVAGRELHEAGSGPRARRGCPPGSPPRTPRWR